MASSDLETQAKEAFIADHFELAADLYSQAIALSPNNPELFADRAQANIKLQNFTGEIDKVFFFLISFRVYVWKFRRILLVCFG
ncbi:protein sgt1 homolog [Phtheirospermum japonicum]|uniref:Protein sgt1 homolog n=1 Tax=Phtheirospermum japonicum TaxID=374723 RepID=A0A830CET4_9LAMI|nr:protein sgt1 homolog [Phtheirospermum japonicum]